MSSYVYCNSGSATQHYYGQDGSNHRSGYFGNKYGTKLSKFHIQRLYTAKSLGICKLHRAIGYCLTQVFGYSHYWQSGCHHQASSMSPLFHFWWVYLADFYPPYQLSPSLPPQNPDVSSPDSSNPGQSFQAS